MKKEKLLLATVILLAIAFATSVGILVYYITHSQELTVNIQKSIQQELQKYNIESAKFSIDDSKIVLAVARYCSEDDRCRGDQGFTMTGRQGDQGIQGAQGLQGEKGDQGIQGESMLPINGLKGEKGDQGEPGKAGPKTERRCDAQNNRVEWRNEGDENWQVEYQLAPLQMCPTGEQI